MDDLKMVKQLRPVQSKLLYPISFSLLLLVVGFFLLLGYLQQKNSDDAGEHLLRIAQLEFEQSVREELRLITLLAELLQDLEELPPLLAAQDAKGLSDLAQRSFVSMREGHQITHFYFHNLDGVNLIRLHEPGRRGDKIERHTMQQAMQGSEVATGIELGILGTLTLRVVQPVYNQDQLVGYLELGKELQTSFANLEQTLGLGVVMFIEKRMLDPTDWRVGAELLERSFDWELFEQYAVYYSSASLAQLLTSQSPRKNTLTEPSDIAQFQLGSDQWRVFGFPVRAASGDVVGRLALFQNIGAERAAARGVIVQFFVVAGVLAGALLYGLWRILRRLDGHIVGNRQALEQGQVSLETAQQIAKLGSWSFDLRAKILHLSREMKRLLALDNNTTISVPEFFTPWSDPRDQEAVQAAYSRMLLQKQSVELVHRISTNSQVKHVQQRCYPIFNKLGEIEGVSGTFQDITESVEANQSRMAQERQYRQLLESTAAIPWRLNLSSFQFSYVGPQAEQELGFAQQDWYQQGFWRDHIHPQDLFKLGMCKQQAMAGRPYSFEFRMKDSQGSYSWFSTDAVLTEQGELQGFMFNVTDRRKQELVLKDIGAALARDIGQDFLQQLSQHIYRLFQSDHVLVAKLDPSQKTLHGIIWLHQGKVEQHQEFAVANTPHLQVLLQSSCAIGSELTALFPADSWSEQMGIQSYVGAALTNSEGDAIGLIAMMSQQSLQDVRFPAEVLSIFAARASVELEQSQTKQRLAQKEEESREILNSLIDSVITVDSRGSIIQVNDATQGMFGWTRAELVGANVQRLMPDDTVLKHGGFIQGFTDPGKAEIVGTGKELIAQRKDGSQFPVRFTLAELPVDISGELHFVCACADLTEQRQQEEMLRRSQKMDALGKLTGGVAHDYNNILGIIMGYAELMDQMLEDDSKFKGFAKEIYQAAKRGSRLAQKLLSFSRKAPRNSGVCNLNECISQQRQVLATSLTSRIALTLELDKELGLVALDQNDFDDALLNMAINAQHAMGESQGKLLIQTTNLQLAADNQDKFALPSGDYVAVKVKDNGQGMDEQTKERIFEPFFTTKGEKGTGLGLSSVYGFVKRSGGDIQVRSEPGHGCEFILVFPRVEQEVEQSDDSNSEQMHAQGVGRVLIVDDEQAMAQAAAMALSRQGYVTHIAGDGHQALKLLASQPVDLVFSDVIMPQMDGFALAAAIKERYPAMRLLLTSGYNEQGFENNPLPEIELLPKPYSMKDLLEKVGHLLKNIQDEV